MLEKMVKVAFSTLSEREHNFLQEDNCSPGTKEYQMP